MAAHHLYAFLSYSRVDQAFAAHLARDLRAQGIQLWFDQLDIAPGQTWDASIQRALHGAGAVLVVISEHSVASENVLNELTVAIDSGKWVIPIMIGRVQVPLRIARLQHVDFVSDYAAGVARLVAYMRGGPSRTTELAAIAQAPAARPSRSSLEPTFETKQPAPPQRGWLVPMLLGAGVGIVGLFTFAMFVNQASSADDTHAAAPRSAGLPPADAVNSGTLKPEALEGTWFGVCEAAADGTSTRDSLGLSGSTYSFDKTYFAESTCGRALFAINLALDIVALNGGERGVFQADYRVRGATMVPIESASVLNQKGFFNYRQWSDGVPVQLAAPVVLQLFGAPLTPGTMVYDLLAVDKDGLREGRSATSVALTPSARTTELDVRRYTRQQ